MRNKRVDNDKNLIHHEMIIFQFNSFQLFRASCQKSFNFKFFFANICIHACGRYIKRGYGNYEPRAYCRLATNNFNSTTEKRYNPPPTSEST